MGYGDRNIFQEFPEAVLQVITRGTFSRNPGYLPQGFISDLVNFKKKLQFRSIVYQMTLKLFGKESRKHN